MGVRRLNGRRASIGSTSRSTTKAERVAGRSRAALCLWAFGVGLSSVSAVPAAATAIRIGETIQVVPSASRQGEGEKETLGLGGSVYADDRVNTGGAGKADLEFLDKARFEVG